MKEFYIAPNLMVSLLLDNVKLYTNNHMTRLFSEGGKREVNF